MCEKRTEERPSSECPPACRDMVLSLFAQQRENTVNGLFRYGFISFCCGASAMIGVLICRLA